MTHNTQETTCYTANLNEPSRADSAEFVDTFPRASGEDVRQVMRQKGISIVDAAKAMETTQARVREVRQRGLDQGLSSWEWMRAMPDRVDSHKRIRNPKAWREGKDLDLNKALVMSKIVHVKIGDRLMPCVAIRMNERDAPKFVEVLFGQCGHDQLNFMNRDPDECLFSAHMSDEHKRELVFAHLWMIKFWFQTHSGSVIDIKSIRGPAPRTQDGIDQRERVIAEADRLLSLKTGKVA